MCIIVKEMNEKMQEIRKRQIRTCSEIYGVLL